MPRKHIEIEPGTKFGLLTVLEHVEDFRYPNGDKANMYRCACQCGGEKVIAASSLIRDHSHSCGCLIGRISTRILDLTGQNIREVHSYRAGT